jgi:hypothetical protein
MSKNVMKEELRKSERTAPLEIAIEHVTTLYEIIPIGNKETSGKNEMLSSTVMEASSEIKHDKRELSSKDASPRKKRASRWWNKRKSINVFEIHNILDNGKGQTYLKQAKSTVDNGKNDIQIHEASNSTIDTDLELSLEVEKLEEANQDVAKLKLVHWCEADMPNMLDITKPIDDGPNLARRKFGTENKTNNIKRKVKKMKKSIQHSMKTHKKKAGRPKKKVCKDKDIS